MKVRTNFLATSLWIGALAFLLSAAPDQAEIVRVTTWNLQPSDTAGTNGGATKFQQALIAEAAESLKKLDPDVIILQQIAGWETCNQLTQALRPEIYQVTICSSFRDPHTKLLRRQVAILSKTKAYLSWSDLWQSNADSSAAPGGYAFAAVRLAGKNVGIFSVQLSDGALAGAEDSRSDAAQKAREESARQLIQQIVSLRNWTTNHLQAFIVAGDFDTTQDDLRLVHEKTLPGLEQFGFENAFAGLPLEQRVTLPGNGRRSDATLDYIFTRDAGWVSEPLISQTTFAGHHAVTCELDLAASRRIATPPSQLARVELPQAKSAANPTNRLSAPVELAEATPPADTARNLLWLAGFLAACLTLFVVVRRIRRRLHPAFAALPEAKPKARITIAIPPGDQVVVAPPPGSPPFVHIEMEGSTQTQSQTWQPLADAGRVTARMPAEVREGVIANLSRWLKQRLLQRLVSDRAQLLATQQAAALKVLAVDARLTKIEQQIQQRNQDYEKRIDDLQKELLTAREENRELIRAKIALVKAEMEKARVKVAQHTKEHQQN